MCFDIQTSLVALFVNICSSIALFLYAKKSENKQLKVISFFFLFVGFMQFWDAIFWTYDSTTKINIYSTKLAMIWNHLEPIILALLIYVFMGNLTIFSKIIIVIYTISSILYSSNGWNSLTCTRVTKYTCGSLYWQWNDMRGYSFFYTLFFISLIILSNQFTGWIKWASILITSITFFFSFYKYKSSSSVGRFWCYFAAFSPLFFLIGSKIDFLH